MDLGIKDKCALVTGGSRGIGAQTAVCLAQEGCRVIITYNHSKDAAENVVKEIIGLGADAVALHLDLAIDKSIADLFVAINDRWGGVDILVCNAGYSPQSGSKANDYYEWSKTEKINVYGHYLCCQHAAKTMIPEGWGRIIFISSLAGIFGSRTVSYASSKGAVQALAMSLAKDMGPHGITVNAIAPGPIETDMLAPLTEAKRNYIQNLNYVKQIGKPADVAAAVCFLAGKIASYIHGTILIVDGGMHLGV